MTSGEPNDVRALIAKLSSEYNALEERIGAIKHTLEAAQHVLAVLSKEERSIDPSLATISLVEVRACKTQREVLYLYAKANGGFVHVGKVSHMIHDSGMSKGKYSSIRSTLHNMMTKQANEWEWVEPGIFRLKSANGVYSKQIVDEDDFQPLPLIHDGMTP